MRCSGYVPCERLPWRGVPPQDVEVPTQGTGAGRWLEALRLVVCFLVSGRAAYWGTRYDGKARAETNMFERNHLCTYICEQCEAQNPVYRHEPEMSYKDFRVPSARRMTYMTHEDYMATCAVASPWSVVQGWPLGTCTWDVMHVVLLGTGQDLIGSLLADWAERGCLGDCSEPLNKRLRTFSLEMHRAFRSKGFLGLKWCSRLWRSVFTLPVVDASSSKDCVQAAFPDRAELQFGQAFAVPDSVKLLQGLTCEDDALAHVHEGDTVCRRERRPWPWFL